MNFESELVKGNFFIAECIHCQKVIWPPSELCNNCFKETSWRKSECKGKIIEFSKQNNQYFCVVEIEKNLKIIGNISSGIPNIGQEIKIDKCGIKDNNYFFELSLI